MSGKHYLEAGSTMQMLLYFQDNLFIVTIKQFFYGNSYGNFPVKYTSKKLTENSLERYGHMNGIFPLK